MKLKEDTTSSLESIKLLEEHFNDAAIEKAHKRIHVPTFRLFAFKTQYYWNLIILLKYNQIFKKSINNFRKLVDVRCLNTFVDYSSIEYKQINYCVKKNLLTSSSYTYNTFIHTLSHSPSLPTICNSTLQLEKIQQEFDLSSNSKSDLNLNLFLTMTSSLDQNELDNKKKKIFHIDQKSLNNVELKKNLNLLSGVSIIVGVIVGSGIFISPKGILEQSNSIGLSLLIWIFSGLISLIGALCYAELGTAIPKSGGDFSYIREAFGNLAGFLFIWITCLIITPTSNAITALTFANYILVPYYSYIGCENPSELTVQLIAIILVCFLTFINCYNVKLSAFLMNAFTFAKVLALAIIISVGFWQFSIGNSQNFNNIFKGSTTSPYKIALSFYAGLFSYAGWNSLNFVTEELKNPFKTLPKAIYISLPLVTLIYVLANIAYFTVLSPFEIVESNAIAIKFGDRVLGIFNWTMPLFVVLSTLGGLNGCIFASSRLFFVGAQHGNLPHILGQININYFTPIPSLLFMCITSLIYLSTADVYLLINYAAFNESLFTTFSVASLLWLRYKKPNMNRPIKVNLLLPIIFFTICTFLVLLPIFERPLETGISALITLTGIPVYFLTVYWKNKPALYNRINDSITRFLQKLLITSEERKCL